MQLLENTRARGNYSRARIMRSVAGEKKIKNNSRTAQVLSQRRRVERVNESARFVTPSSAYVFLRECINSISPRGFSRLQQRVDFSLFAECEACVRVIFNFCADMPWMRASLFFQHRRHACIHNVRWMKNISFDAVENIKHTLKYPSLLIIILGKTTFLKE